MIAVDDATEAGIVPHSDPAVMLICNKIAFSGNGDALYPNDYYRKLFRYCEKHIESDNPGTPPPLEGTKQ